MSATWPSTLVRYATSMGVTMAVVSTHTAIMQSKAQISRLPGLRTYRSMPFGVPGISTPLANLSASYFGSISTFALNFARESLLGELETAAVGEQSLGGLDSPRMLGEFRALRITRRAARVVGSVGGKRFADADLSLESPNKPTTACAPDGGI